VNQDRQAVLEAIAFGRDRTIRPAERLRAIELLAELAGGVDVDLELFRRVGNLDGDELQAEQDAIVAAVLISGSEEERRERWPRTCEVIERRIEERAQEIGRGTAEEIYRSRAFLIHQGGEEV